MLSENTKKYAKFIDKREQNIYTVAVDKRSARREVATSDGPDHEGMHFMAKSIMDHDRVLRQVLREAVERFNHELLDDEERQLLLDRIRRLRRKLAS